MAWAMLACLVTLLVATIGLAHGNDAGSRQPRWQEQCARFSAFSRNIWEDLLPWQETGITAEMLDAAQAGAPNTISIMIRNGELLVEDTAKGLTAFMPWHARIVQIYAYALQHLVDKWGAEIPVVEFLLSPTDGPSQDIARPRGSTYDQIWQYFPVFRHCRSTDSADITVPIYHLYEMRPSEKLFSRIDMRNAKYPWGSKKRFAFGAGTAYYRNQKLGANVKHFEHNTSTVVEMVREAFASYTRDELQAADVVYMFERPIEEWAEHKAVIHVDGIACSSRLWQLLSSNSVVLREVSGYWSFFDRLLKPFVHYVPFWKHRPREVAWAWQWVAQHDAEAQRITENAQAFVREFLNKPALECYWLMLLHEYAQLQRFEPGSRGQAFTAQAAWMAKQRKTTYGKEHNWIQPSELEYEEPRTEALSKH